jgi:hypothetical protein
MKNLIIVMALIFMACNSDITPTTPTPLPNPPGMVDEPPTPPPARVDAPFSWESFAGFTAFALGHPGQTEEDIRGLYFDGLSRGWNTARICSETEFWDGNALYPRKPRDAARLRWLLDTIATIPGAQVLLIGDCTLKRQVPLGEALNWARTVAAIAGEYENIAIETHNEFANCRGRSDWGGSAAFCPGKQDVATHIQSYRNAGISSVTADDRIAYGDFPDNIQFRFSNIGARPADFHPQRDRVLGTDSPWDPARRQIRQLYEANGMVLFSEIVALGDATGACKGLRTCDMGRIQTFVNECDLVDEENGDLGCKIVFHSELLLAGEPPGEWPNSKKQ